MKTLTLHGNLVDKYGKEFKLDVHTPQQMIKAVGYQLPGFFEDINDGEFIILRNGEAISEEHLTFSLGKRGRMDLIPMPSGSGGRGVGKILLGSVILAGAFIFAPASVTLGGGLLGPTTASGLSATAFAGISFSQIVGFGAAIALSGVAQAISPTPSFNDYGNREKPDERASALLNSRVNTIEEGQPLPLIFGRIRAGSIPISAGINVEQVPLVEVLDIETEFSSVHTMTVKTQVVGSDTWRGFSIEQLSPFSTPLMSLADDIDPTLYRFNPLINLITIDDGVNKTLQVDMRITGRNHFLKIIINKGSNGDETFEGFTDPLLDSTFSTETLNLRVIPHNDDEAYVDSEIISRWTWDVTGVDVFPIAESGMVITLEY